MGFWVIFLALFSSSVGAASPQKSQFWDPCLLPLSRYSVVYRLLASPARISALSVPGDRALVRMASQIEDLNPARLTPEGLKILSQLLIDTNPEKAIAEIAERHGMSAQTAVESVKVDGEFWIRHMFQARDRANWNEVIRTYDVDLKGPWQSVVEARLQTALALNRRNANGGEDRKRALRMVDQVIAEVRVPSVLAEAYGIKARVYKDLGNLEHAIQLYITGFEHDPAEYYPGVAAIMLLLGMGTQSANARAEQLAPRIQLAINGSIRAYAQQRRPPDYWLMSSALILAILQHQWEHVSLLIPDVLTLSGGTQNLETTMADLRRLERAWVQQGVERGHLAHLQGAIQLFDSALLNPRVLLSLSEASPSYTTTKAFADMEGIFDTSPIYLKKALRDSEIEEDLLRATHAPIDVMTFHKFLQASVGAGQNVERRFLLARTGEYQDVVRIIADQSHTRPWWFAYGDVGLSLNPNNADEFFDRALKQGKEIYFLVPAHFRSRHQNARTLKEFDSALRHLPGHERQFHFVFGFEHVFPADYRARLIRGQTAVPVRYTSGVVEKFVGEFQKWLVQLGDQVRGFNFGTGLFDESLYPLIYDQVLRRLSFHQQLRRLHSKAMPYGTPSVPVKILDAGGGTGLVAGAAVEEDPNRDVEIFDRSEAMLLQARAQGFSDEILHNSDIQEMVRRDGKIVDSNSIDGVMSSNVIYLLNREQILAFFKEVHRVLKKGGRFSVSSMLKADMKVHMDFLRDAIAETKSLEDRLELPLGASEILSSSNRQLLKRAPTLLSFQEVAALAAEAGLHHLTEYDQHAYEGAGFFMVFRK